MKTKHIFALLYCLSVVIFLAHFIKVGNAVYGDGRFYYSYLSTFFVHHTINFSQAFQHFGINERLTPNHIPANKYSIGSPIVWTIPFIFINTLLMPFHANNGYNNIYQIAIGIWNITLVFVGLYFLRKTLLHYFSETTANLTTVFLFLATNLLFYGAVDVINSHSSSFFAATIFVYLWLKNKTTKQSFLLGFFLALLMLIRLQDILYIILPLTTLIMEKKKYLRYFIIVIITTVITYLPQLIIWKLEWGTWYVNPYLLDHRFYYFQPNFTGILFGKTNGLFLWTPLLIICTIGLFLFAKTKKTIGVPLILIFLLELYVVASWITWWQGASYSGRMLISSLPLLAIGLGYVLSQKKLERILIPICISLSLLNPILIIFYLLYAR